MVGRLFARRWATLAAVFFLMCVWTSGAEGASGGGVWLPRAEPGFAGGSGTEDDPWRIETPGQLVLLAEKVNAGGPDNADYRVGHYILTNDIDLSDYEWVPIGIATSSGSLLPVSGQSFGGVFHGAGHAIRGLRYNSNTESGVGLFGSVSGGWIKEVSLEVDIRVADNRTPVRIAVGGLVGLMQGGVVASCDVHGTISGGASALTEGSGFQAYIGGVVGYSREASHIVASTNGASVTGFFDTITSGGAGNFVGGIVGRAFGEVSNCVNSGTVAGGMLLASSGARELSTGGIAGGCFPPTVEISFCINNGAVTGGDSDGSSFTGGIIGNAYASKITFCLNNGAIDGGPSTNNAGVALGGIVGLNFSGQVVEITNSANTGTVTGSVSRGSQFVGGIVGDNVNGTLTNTYNYADVQAKAGTTPTIGGVAGRNSKTIVSSYWNSDRTVVGGKGVGAGTAIGVSSLGAPAFASAASFAGWSISATPGFPGGNSWFYPVYDTSRPHLSNFFDANGQPRVRVAPNALIFGVGQDAGRLLTLSVGDGFVSALGGQLTVNPYGINGMSFSVVGDAGLHAQYANGNTAGNATAAFAYLLDGKTSGIPPATFGVRVLPSLAVGAQSRTVRQGDLLTLSDPLILSLTLLGGTGIFRAPSIDSESGLVAAVAGSGTILEFVGRAGTPGGYPVEVFATVNGLPASAGGSVTILPSEMPPPDPESGDVVILRLDPPVATVNVATNFVATASRPVSGAILRAVYQNGESADIPVSARGNALSFSFTPIRTGIVTLMFTMYEADGEISHDSIELAVRRSDGVTVSGLTPPWATLGVSTAFTAETSRPVSGATLRVTYADGFVGSVPVSVSGSTLSFTFAPVRVGLATLAFIMTEADGSSSMDSVWLVVRPAIPGAELIESLTISPAPPYRVGDELLITMKLTRASAKAAMRIDTPRGTVETLLVSQNGDTATARYVPGWAGAYRLIADAADGEDLSVEARTFLVAEGSGVVTRGHHSGCDVFLPGGAALLFAAVAVFGPGRLKRLLLRFLRAARQPVDLR